MLQITETNGSKAVMRQRVTAHGVFDRKLDALYQSEADFELSLRLWNRFPQAEVVMTSHDLDRAKDLLPDVARDRLARIKTKCNMPCGCGRENNALDLIEFSLNESIHGSLFLSKIFNETRENKKISIMDSVHKKPWLPKSVLYIDDTKPIPCVICGEEIHLYLRHDSLLHLWH